MAEVKKSDDYAFALKVCQKLRAGSRKAILAVHSRYHQRFIGFVRQRLNHFPHAETDKVLNSFWLELMNGKAICAYQGQGPLSLCSFLMINLKWRIKDEIRHLDKENKARVRLASDDDSDFAEDESISYAALKAGDSETVSVENALMRKECVKIIHAVLSQLQEEAPKDAWLIRMYFLEGLTYKEMAISELIDEEPDSDMIKKKENSIKKQVTRPRSGSMAKFKSLLNHHLRKLGICYTDLIA